MAVKQYTRPQIHYLENWHDDPGGLMFDPLLTDEKC